jgi:hypothetical protein
MSTPAFYSLSTVCQYFSQYPLWFLCHYVQCGLLQFFHCLSVPQTVPFLSSVSLCNCCLLYPVHCPPVPHTLLSLISVSLCPILPSTVCPLSVSTAHCTVSWFCVTMSTFVLYILFTVCQDLTLYTLSSVSICPMLLSTVCPLSVRTSHNSFSYVSVTMSNAAFYSLSKFCQYLTLCHFVVLCHYVPAAFYSPSTVCQYLTLYLFLFLCHYVHCYLLQSVHCQRVLHIVPSLISVSLCPLLPATVCPLSVSTSQWTVSSFCVAMSTAVFCSLSTVCYYLTLYRLLFLWHYIHCCLLQSVKCLSVPHNVPSLVSVSLCPLLSSKEYLLSVSTSKFTVCCFCVTTTIAAFYSLSTTCQFLTLNCLFILCHQ